MRTFKCVVIALCVMASLSTAYAFVTIHQGVAQVKPQTDTQVILGHRIGPSGQLELVVAK